MTQHPPAEELKALIRTLFDKVWNLRQLDKIEEIFSSDTVCFLSSSTIHGAKAIQEVIAYFLEAFPDVMHTVEEMIVQDNKVVCRWKGHGTHQGEYLGLTPTGKKMTYYGISIFHVIDGKVRYSWACTDIFGLLQQLK